MAIPRHEVAPVTDQEWSEALYHYGRDRRDSKAEDQSRLLDSETAICSSPTSSPRPRATLIHQDSSESLQDQFNLPPRHHVQKPTRQSTHASLQSGCSEHINADGLLLPTHEENGRSPRTSFGSTDGISPSELNKDPSRDYVNPLNMYPVPAHRPGHNDSLENDQSTGEAERRNLREHYEKEGWLPGPQASKTTRLRRKRAIRRLGLCCNQDTSYERQAVIAKYTELAQSIFQCTTSTVSILLGDEEYIYGSSTEPPFKCRANETPCSHAVLFESLKCTVIADFTKDWRFRNSPIRSSFPGKFYASAPLRYHRNNTTIDIGALCIFDEKPRDSFDEREQSILINLANMLVYQLNTLIMAKKSSSMYENCISFLRRSVMPNTEQEKELQEQQRKETRELEKAHRKERRQGKATAVGTTAANTATASHTTTTSPLARPRRASRADSYPSDTGRTAAPMLSIKTGPRDSKAAKRDADFSEKTLFSDAAKTLRNILKADAVAIVNLEEYQLFIRRASGMNVNPSKKKIKEKTKEAIISSFLQGKPWPEDIDPVIHYVPRSNQPGVTVLGTDASLDCEFHFDKRGSEQTLSEFLQTFLKHRHFWWDREDGEDDLSRRIMDLMPAQSQTILGTAFMTWEGKTKFAMFASWDRPPSEFGDSQTIALPYAWILGGCLSAAMAIRKIRTLEQSQISYSNLQAHELRTPLHQILAITQLLRSSMNDLAETPHSLNTSSLTTTQQIRDLLPFLDAIDTSGKTLHGIVDNILSFLDLKGKDNSVSPSVPSLLNSPAGAAQSLEVMFEELIHDACEEDKRSRQANGSPLCHTETVFEIIPPLLGEQITEDAGGALRRAMAKILSNAYKFIEGEGCVEIYVDDVPDLLPPEGCEDLALTKRIKIIIVDNGKGMEHSFVKEKLGEPWAKEDPYATGSGLSVHLAYRIIDLMGGEMRISSGPGQGCRVQLEVPLPRRSVISPKSPEMLSKRSEDIELKRKIALVGFDSDGPGSFGLMRLTAALEHQYTKLGCELVKVEDADLVLMEGHVEETLEGVDIFENTPAKDIVLLVGTEHEAHPQVLSAGKRLGKTVRRFRKPATPSILRETLFPGQSKELVSEMPSRNGSVRRRINAPQRVSSHGQTVSESTLVDPSTPSDKPRPHFLEEQISPVEQGHITPALIKDNISTCPIVAKLAALWKPRNMDVEDAVACLSLGDYFSSRKRSSILRTPSNASSHAPSSVDTHEYHSTPQLGTPSVDSEGESFEPRLESEEVHEDDTVEEAMEPVPEELVKVLVVEDNMVNRKILVKILSSKLPIEVLEAEDGHAAVELFKEFTAPAIVLLDINMPKMDGYQACLEMRAIEKAAGRKGPSQIIAVTALSSEEEKRRGLVECGMNQWHTKPCSKTQIHKIVEEARSILAEAKRDLKGLF